MILPCVRLESVIPFEVTTAPIERLEPTNKVIRVLPKGLVRVHRLDTCREVALPLLGPHEIKE